MEGGATTSGTPMTPADPSFDMAKRWKGVVTNAQLTGDFAFTPLALPVVHTVNGDNWEPLDWQMVTKVQQAVMNYGIDNWLVCQQIQVVMKYQNMVPAEIHALMELILGPRTYLLSLTKWQECLEEKQISNLDLPHHDPLRVASLEQLMGSRQFRDPNRQAGLHPHILAQFKIAALEALAVLPQVGKPNLPYLKMTQWSDELFLGFVDRVREAVDAAPNIPMDMKTTMVKEIVTQNANPTCKHLIATLPLGATLMQMVEICSRAPLEKEWEKAKIHATALAAALKQAPKQDRGDKGLSGGCFVCGRAGHFNRDCPERKKESSRNVQPRQPTSFGGNCKRCDKFGHKAQEC